VVGKKQIQKSLASANNLMGTSSFHIAVSIESCAE
jgi:hypothetical protein